MNILIWGVSGRMGSEVARLCREGYRGAVAVGGFDVAPAALDFPVWSDPAAITAEADCIVDFSHHAGTVAMLDFAMAHKIPAVIATTGHTEEELEAIRRAAEVIPVFHSANMSLGIALLVELAKTAALAMPEADIEIVEKHHNRKLDAPSGTALMLSRAIREVRPEKVEKLGRSGMAKREKNEIGIHAIRMGNVIGEHEVILGTDTQTVTLKHEAHSRALFAEGGLCAAEFLITHPAGLYQMNDMIRG